MSGHTQSDAMIARLEGELEERNAFIQGTIASAQDTGRDLTDNEAELIKSAKARVDNVRSQLDTLYDSRTSTMDARRRAVEVSDELSRLRQQSDNGPVEYRTAGAYMLDSWKAHTGDRQAGERLEIFSRAAAHQKTGDNPGIIPDPIVGGVVNFIDAARPLVSMIGPQDLPSATWHRPKVTQHTAVGKQGVAGGAADEKTELVSQKMLITRLTANAVTYGGYVNVSRQNIDFSGPQALDLVVNDLASQYAIETEAATAAALSASTNTVELTTGLTATPTDDELLAGVWKAVANVYNATKGQGRLVLALSADQLGVYGRLFGNYVNPQNAASPGFSANSFGQGVMGSISGVPVVMSSGLATGSSVLFSTSAVEVFEQRVGALQVTEPSVLGVQIAYAGYFTPLTIEAGGIQKIVNAA